MAGNYPDVPSWRMAYDRDGTQVYTVSSTGVVTQLTTAQIAVLNDEADDTFAWTVVDSTNNNRLMFWFPEKRDLDGFFVAGWTGGGSVSGCTVEVSTDTTNGVDGTWSQIKASYSPPPGVVPSYRNAIQSVTSLGIRAVRFVWDIPNFSTRSVKVVHLYGEPIPGANPDRLALWHPTLDQRIIPSYFDWGDVPRTSSADKQFRVKNLSSTLTASSIRVAQEILTDAVTGNPSVVGQHTLSTDGVTFLPQVNCGTLSPGTLSGVLTLRRVTPSNAQLGVWAHRVFAEAGSWA